MYSSSTVARYSGHRVLITRLNGLLTLNAQLNTREVKYGHLMGGIVSAIQLAFENENDTLFTSIRGQLGKSSAKFLLSEFLKFVYCAFDICFLLKLHEPDICLIFAILCKFTADSLHFFQQPAYDKGVVRCSAGMSVVSRLPHICSQGSSDSILVLR